MFGLPSIPYGPLGIASGADTRPVNTTADTSALQKLLAVTRTANQTPQGRIDRGFHMFGPQSAAPVAPMLPTPPTPGPVNMGPGALSPQTAEGPEAPIGPPAPHGFFGHAPVAAASTPAPTPADMGQAANMPIGPNYMMPAFGTASNQGSDPNVIDKLLSFFKNKDNPSA